MPGVDHLEDVVVFEHVGSFVDDHDGLAACFQLRVQLGDAVVIRARFPDKHRLAGQIVDRGNRRRSRPGDDHLAHVGARRLGEGGDRLQFGPDRHHRRDHVHLALQEGWRQQIARHRQDHHMHLEVARLEVRVQIGLEQLEGLERQPALLPLVDEIVRAVERHAHANRAALDDLVEVSGERLVRQAAPLPGGHPSARRCPGWARRPRRGLRSGVAAVVVAGGVSCCRSVQAVAAAVRASRATPPRQTPDRGHRVFIVVMVVFLSISRLQAVQSGFRTSPRRLHRKTEATWHECGTSSRRVFSAGNCRIPDGAEALRRTAHGMPEYLPNGRSSGRLRLRRDWHSGNLHASLAGF